MFSLARRLIELDPNTRSVMLLCSECWNDEADDAIQQTVLSSPQLVIMPGAIASVDFRLTDEILRWQANLTSIWAFAAMCTEEGWEEDTGMVSAPKGAYVDRDSPVMIIQRDGDQLRGSWLGRPLRGWLDVPTAMQDRVWRQEPGGPPSIPDEPPAPLVGRELELHDQVLADPSDRGVRDVLRDLWIERGDPRGEYCAVSDPRAIDHLRAAALIAEHGRSWVGALQPVIPLSGALFGYGPWIRSAIVYAEPAALTAASDAAAWGSIERIVFAMGSARLISPRMINARAIGPLTLDQLDPLRVGSWKLRELDVEIDRDPSDLVTLALPLTTLRLRPARGLEWLSRLDELARAPALERIEIWLPGGVTTDAEAARVFREASGRVGDKTLVVGVLDTGQPTGWTLVSRAGVQTVELVKPDLRFGLGEALAGQGITAMTPGLVDLDEDWLTFALGVPAIQPL